MRDLVKAMTSREFLAVLSPAHEWHTVAFYDRKKQVITCHCGQRLTVSDANLKAHNINPKTRTALDSVPFPSKP